MLTRINCSDEGFKNMIVIYNYMKQTKIISHCSGGWIWNQELFFKRQENHSG